MPTALLSVFDKTGLLPLATGLKALGWHLLATGGTLKTLRDADIAAQEVAEYTGAPECFDGRVKTLHPRIHGGLLFRRESPAHTADAQRLAIAPIDLVVVNLYPFEATLAQEGVRPEDCIEQIDIGGPSMLRSAAKNHASVTVLTDPAQYETYLKKLADGTWSLADRRQCALQVFQRTAAYDSAIATWFASQWDHAPQELSDRLTLGLTRKQSLRYGENPHQNAGFYLRSGAPTEGLAACAQLQGKELSYNNLLDADAAARLAWQFETPACVIVKHNNPCGAALGATALAAFQKALASDPMSAFGGIVAFNQTLDAEVAHALAPTFWEVILAPAFTEAALAILKSKPNLRLLQSPDGWPSAAQGLETRSIGGGFLVQCPDDHFMPPSHWDIKATGKSPRPADQDLLLAQSVAKALKSNAIALVREGGTVGCGAGQMSRVDAVDIACRKAGARAQGAVLGSDAFFPFADGLELAAQHGVIACVEPGGSTRDAEVIEAAQRLGIWLFFTGMRHFRH